MATDMDIEMDIDVGFAAEQDFAVQDVAIVPESEPAQQLITSSAPNDSSAPDALQLTPTKIHLRGLDDLTTDDIKSFASEYFSTSEPSVEWIDDTSANLVYETLELASEALIAFAAVEIVDVSQIPLLQTIPAKAFPSHPRTNLEVRLAVVGDRKQRGARERSRFYLFNPEHDPAERRKHGGPRGGNRYRDRDDGGYRSQRYNDREQRKRQLDDEDAGFTANLYDDDEAALNARRNKGRRGSTSSGGLDGRDGRRGQRRGAAGRELFPDRADRDGGRLRDRSASPMRDRDGDREDDARSRRQDMAASANRQKAQMIKAQLRDSTHSKELFPNKTANHRRPVTFDAADATADLFARQMPVPLLDGSSDDRPNASLPLAARISTNSGRLSIRGAARANPTHDFAIKGAAGGGVRELFPSGGNAGKELFSERIKGRGGRRNKAEDLFY